MFLSNNLTCWRGEFTCFTNISYFWCFHFNYNWWTMYKNVTTVKFGTIFLHISVNLPFLPAKKRRKKDMFLLHHLYCSICLMRSFTNEGTRLILVIHFMTACFMHLPCFYLVLWTYFLL
jgi:hypothetical protein